MHYNQDVTEALFDMLEEEVIEESKNAGKWAFRIGNDNIIAVNSTLAMNTYKRKNPAVTTKPDTYHLGRFRDDGSYDPYESATETTYAQAFAKKLEKDGVTVNWKEKKGKK